ncbi:hypothetical protein A6R68_11828 [Neotoma lepida]|uniref:Uncharacterized protein n=1 Tax=Neotoma lepida TaxID=56216 RepID=A0A1A6FTY5_NEOLE|nr:hypothetical protein A6R68_11828 [Neotoma lepida]
MTNGYSSCWSLWCYAGIASRNSSKCQSCPLHCGISFTQCHSPYLYLDGPSNKNHLSRVQQLRRLLVLCKWPSRGSSQPEICAYDASPPSLEGLITSEAPELPE